jgi:cytochrome c-type biogenesis protein CcmH/NrfG
MWTSFIELTKNAYTEFTVRRRKVKTDSDAALAQGPSWRHRRRLIYGAYIIAMLMIIFGALTVFTTSQIGVEMIIGGVALLSIIVTAYTTSATYEDVRLWNHQPRIRFGESAEEVHDELDTDNPDGL